MLLVNASEDVLDNGIHSGDFVSVRRFFTQSGNQDLTRRCCIFKELLKVGQALHTTNLDSGVQKNRTISQVQKKVSDELARQPEAGFFVNSLKNCGASS